MSAPDPTAGEREHPTCVASGPHYFPEQCQGESVWVTFPPAVAASTGTSEDVEALWSAIVAWTDDPTDEATEAVERIVAAREAAARVDERERIAQAIIRRARNGGPLTVDGAARIAREGRP